MRLSFPKLAAPALTAILLGTAVASPTSFDLSLSRVSDRAVKWPSKNIRVAISTSLSEPTAGIKVNSDVAGAVRRALHTWSSAANITFVVVPSKAQSISPTSGGDGVNLITIASTAENLGMFDQGDTTARTRVFFDSETGDISEADIALNPYIFSAEGDLIEFSTDGSPGTYDLESTLTHEIGHLLGLDHSTVIGSTMQATQAINGTFGLPAVAQRTLSDCDRAAVRAIYDSREKLGTVEGRILISVEGTIVAAPNAHVWIEDIISGRVVASGYTMRNGRFSLSGFPTGQYRALVDYMEEPVVLALNAGGSPARMRAFRSVEISGNLRVGTEKAAVLNYVLVPPQNTTPSLTPQVIGLNGELSTVPITAKAGSRLTIYVGGKGVENVPGIGFTVSSSSFTVDASSLARELFLTGTPVVSFEVTVAANAPPGDYTLKLQSNSGETAYLVGCITVEPKP